MRLFSRQPKHLADVPVSVTSLRAASGKTLLRALMGGAIAFLALLLVLIASGGADAQSLLLVVATMTGAAAGAATALLQPFPSELRPLREELRHETSYYASRCRTRAKAPWSRRSRLAIRRFGSWARIPRGAPRFREFVANR
jgi:hypothetical protein